jgi:2-polyprenyl-3-methyl-5-hydroxy-6-metoxy-1,4-benzoquinol methylase
MNLRDYYERYGGEACQQRPDRYISKRIQNAALLFQKHLAAPQRLLDVGCGAGIATAYLKDALDIQETFGVDIAETNIQCVREQKITALLCDLNSEPLPFEDSFFDAIFAGEIIEHLIDPDHLLREVHRTLTENGVFVLSTPNLASWYNRIALLLGWQPLDSGTSFCHDVGRPGFLRFDEGGTEHLRLYTLRALKELMLINGFKVVDVAATPAKESQRRIGLSIRIAVALDKLMTFKPSLGARLIVAAKRK